MLSHTDWQGVIRSVCVYSERTSWHNSLLCCNVEKWSYTHRQTNPPKTLLSLRFGGPANTPVCPGFPPLYSEPLLFCCFSLETLVICMAFKPYYEKSSYVSKSSAYFSDVTPNFPDHLWNTIYTHIIYTLHTIEPICHPTWRPTIWCVCSCTRTS